MFVDLTPNFPKIPKSRKFCFCHIFISDSVQTVLCSAAAEIVSTTVSNVS